MEENQHIIQFLLNDYSKEFIVTIISGILLLTGQFLYKYIKNKLKYKQYSGYIGTYYTYTISTKESRHITSYSYKIKYRLGKLIFVSTDKSLKYDGEVLITDKNIYLYSKGLEHEEYIHMIFHKPLNNKLTFSMGVMSGISILNEPTSKVIIISNKKLENNDVEEFFSKSKFFSKKLLTIIPISEKFYN